jgi:hypothetical protein
MVVTYTDLQSGHHQKTTVGIDQKAPLSPRR